uniref:Amino acid/amide ABC transporter membrane protein 2, HAAT family n=1 Tax=Candidatus Kentrum sp. TUN TaxID=2126343 RepID=A0A451ABK9_9GAMM|nr:MAG: amino acid/amide ABC transporter membrane protein 2, HAAT family [Candidatus Kentron sp. TUN]VFK63419.1 MAG: amino acid/amide ABC transporter membrane protein 2, HAAT family [Candidatus Kentron sp. TUN]VFK68271.1 MAG: amino acid/amide ABC transporter membrane protein 2, HAAT family [Candidatus Kentron sp. TUN]
MSGNTLDFKLNHYLIITGFVLALLPPVFLEDFTVFQLTQALVYAIAILGLNLLTGFNGQFSLGHSAFYALGAYIAAILMDQWGVAYYWTFIPAGMLCLVAGFLFGLPALRLEGLYLALATFALAVATPQILKYHRFEEITGGVQGIDLDKPVSPLSYLTDDQWLYYFVLVVMVVLFMGARNLIQGRVGRAIIAIRDNPIAAKTMGINIALYKSLTFGVSAFYTGVAGALSAIIIQFVAPDTFTFFLAITFLVGSVIGGITSIFGAIFGGFFVLLVPNLADALGIIDAKGLSWAIYGIFLILAVHVMPGGAAGMARRIAIRFGTYARR